MPTAFLFPGQGAQHVGMAKDLCDRHQAAAELFDRAEEVTGLEIKKLCFQGPDEQLARTDIAQPAIFTASAALLAVLKQTDKGRSLQPDLTAGLSLGEYTALYAADALGFDEMVKLVARRGELMQQAAEENPSSMVALIGADEDQAVKLSEAAAQGQVLAPANFNCPGQIVLSGHTEACQRAEQMAGQFEISGAKMLNVAGAFHSELMAPAAEAFATDLAAVSFCRPSITVLANVDAQPYESAEQIPQKLLAQLTGAVRWQQCMQRAMADGADVFYEIGPGKVLAGLMRRIHRRADLTTINSLDTLEKFVST
ncbi:MAG: ACP S-malonyltransferase [Planctomycetota bacterium]